MCAGYKDTEAEKGKKKQQRNGRGSASFAIKSERARMAK